MYNIIRLKMSMRDEYECEYKKTCESKYAFFKLKFDLKITNLKHESN